MACNECVKSLILYQDTSKYLLVLPFCRHVALMTTSDVSYYQDNRPRSLFLVLTVQITFTMYVIIKHCHCFVSTAASYVEVQYYLHLTLPPVFKHHAIKAYAERGDKLHAFFYVGKNEGQLRLLYHREKSSLPISYEIGLAPKPVRPRWSTENTLC